MALLEFSCEPGLLASLCSPAAFMASSTVAGKQQHLPKVAQVKNKAPAKVQIIAEYLLREAKERELDLLAPPPHQKITDEEEFNDYNTGKERLLKIT